jgi:hypothetical protein
MSESAGDGFVHFMVKHDAIQSAYARRKAQPVAEGCFDYFPDALLAISEHSRKANEKHNPGEPLQWSKHKSSDHKNCVGRHLLDLGPNWDVLDPEFDTPHAVALAWRSLALLQTLLEAQRAGLTVHAYLAKLKADAGA